MDKIKILIVEDDPDWIKAMTNFINREDDFMVIGTATSKDEAVHMARILDMDVILMDINLSENKHDGIYAAAEISQIKKTKIIMLTSMGAEEIITKSFTAGAVNYISKNNFKEIPKAIRDACNSGDPIEALLKEYKRLKEEEQLQPLSPTEKELYFLIQDGYTQAQIAGQLCKSENTIRNQVNKILKKLEVNNCREAIKKVKLKGLFDEIGLKE